MRARFRSSVLRKRATPHPYHYWEIQLQPFKRESDPGLIGANLLAGEQIWIHGDGSIEPGNLRLKPLRYNRTSQLHRIFTAEVIFQQEPRLPLVYGIKPIVIDDRTRPKPEHLLSASGFEHPQHARWQKWPRSALCYLEAQRIAWRWGTDPVAGLLDDAVTWFAAFALLYYGKVPKWVVAGVPHDPVSVLSLYSPDDRCVCYSNLRFGDCCYPVVKAARGHLGSSLIQSVFGH